MSDEPENVTPEGNTPEATPDAPDAKAFDRSSLTAEERFNILDGKGDDVFKARSAKTEGEKPQDKADSKDDPEVKDEPEEKPAETPEDTKPEDKEDDTEEFAQPKIKVKAKDAKMAAYLNLLQDGVELKDAVKQIYGDEPEAKSKEPETPKEPEKSPFDEIDASIKTVEESLEDLNTQLADAEEAEDIKEVSRLTREVMRKEMEVERLKDSRKNVEEGEQAKAATSFQSRVEASAEKVGETYPELLDEESPEHEEFVAYYKAKAKDPDYAHIFNGHNWPEVMSAQFANSKGILPASLRKKESPPKRETPAASGEPKEPTSQTAPKPEAKDKPEVTSAKAKPSTQTSAARTLTSGDGNESASVQVSRETYQKDRAKLSTDEKFKLLESLS